MSVAAPPLIRETEFAGLDTVDEEEIKRRFAGFVRSLHAYLNDLSCLRDIQKTRRRWKARVASEEPFGNFATDPRHWYTFHHGGRNEAQFNVGLHATHLRVGLGFEFTLKKGGDPTAVHLAYACFNSVVRSDQPHFARFVSDNKLKVEWVGKASNSLQFVDTESVSSWLTNPPQEPLWIFVGRLLRRGHDSAVLEDGVKLGGVMQSVFCGFRPLWERTQMLAKTM